MECLLGFASSVSRDLVCGALNQLRYPCCFNNFVKKLEQEEGDLIVTRDSVQTFVAHAKRQTRKTSEVVDKWLQDATNDVDNVNQLLKEAKTKKICCFGHCPNWIWRYRVGKKLANKTLDLEKFIEEGRKYVPFDRIATLPSGTLNILSEKCINFESRQSAYEKLQEAVKNNDVAMIGLYGMGGCGKTTLAMEVRKLVEAEHLFDKVLFVPISSTVEVRRIQEKIASSLQYTFPETEEMERAQRLCLRLTQEKNILMILDDVWEKLDFGGIGIPSFEHHKGCKILITTRSEEVCTSMDCQRKIYLPILTDEEAWTLFKNKALISEGTPDALKHLGRLISNECKGLPVAIVAVASSLKGKIETIWSVALNKLRSSKPINIERGLTDPYKCLQLSYDNLDTKEAKSLFLLCSVFPEDFEIPVELLTRCAIGLGVVGEAHSYEEARSEVIVAKIKLVSSCLLLDEEDECVKMHDIVRDVAHLIAKNENKIIKCEEEKDVTIEQNSVRYLWCVKFPNDMDYSNLEFLYLRTKLKELDEIFKRMGMLKVLILINDEDGKTPLSKVSFKALKNLRFLLIWGYELSNFTFVSDMKKLQSLSLHECSLPSFPELQTDVVITQVTSLKLLELNKCDIKGKKFENLQKVEVNSCGELKHIFSVSVVRGLVQLKVLEINKCHMLDQIIGDIVPSTDHDKKELDEIIEEGKHPNLYSTSTPSTTVVSYSPDASEARHEDYISIKISNSNYVPPVESVEYLSKQPQGLSFLIMQNIREIELKGFDKVKYLFKQSIASSLMLEILTIKECHGLEHIIDIEDEYGKENLNAIFPNLRNLFVRDCGQLKYMLGQYPIANQDCKEIHIHFSALEMLSLYELPNFVGICATNTLTVTWPSLKEFECDKCSYPFNDSISSLTVLTDSREPISDPKGIQNHFLTLKNVSIRNCEVEGIFCLNGHGMIGQQVSLRLKDLVLENLPQMTYIWVASKNLVNLQHLTILKIMRCAKLKVIFPPSVLRSLPELKRLIIEECMELRQIVGCEEGAPKNSFTFSNLERLEIIGCAKLEVVFPKFVLRCLPELNLVKIRKCKELRQIIEKDVEDETLSSLLSPQPFFPKLEALYVGHCHKLKRFISGSTSNDLPNLHLLIINGTSELEELVGCGQGKCDKIGNTKAELPRLKLLIFIHLPDFHQEIEFSNLKYCVVSECPKISLTPTTTFEELKKTFPYKDFENTRLFEWDIRRLMENLDEDYSISGSSDFTSSQYVIGKDPGSEVLGTATSTDSEHNERSSPSPLDICQNEAHSQEIGDVGNESIEEGPTAEGDKTKSLSTGVEDVSIGGGVATHMESGGVDILARDSMVVEQDDKMNEGMVGTMPSQEIQVEEGLNLLDKQEETHIVSNNNNIDISLDIRTRLGAYKHFVDLDDAQIPLLVDVITTYPHLWTSCEKFSKRFQAWRFKILADILLFLQKESVDSVSHQRDKEFHKLCEEAVEIGFENSWVDEMCQRVVARDPKLREDIAHRQMDENSKRSSSVDMELDSQVVEQGDGLNEKRERTFVGLKTQNVNNSFEEDSNLVDKEGEIVVVSNDRNVAARNEEPEKEFVAKISTSEISRTTTSLTNSHPVERSTTCYLNIPLHETPSNALVDKQRISEPCLMNQENPLGEIVSCPEIPQSIERVAVVETITKNSNVAGSSIYSESTSSQLDQIFTFQSKPDTHTEIRSSKTETSTAKANEGHPKTIQDSGVMNDVSCSKKRSTYKRYFDAQINYRKHFNIKLSYSNVDLKIKKGKVKKVGCCPEGVDGWRMSNGFSKTKELETSLLSERLFSNFSLTPNTPTIFFTHSLRLLLLRKLIGQGTSLGRSFFLFFLLSQVKNSEVRCWDEVERESE
ncbi:hypothetical protein VNO80_23873 [Phaseolus coccineus]|uniref:NB-ARC domain-containing protein n=1 Tax=Phaseolus coccineus TaxID=3886 RepID=A0AAN9QV37_PHACN